MASMQQLPDWIDDDVKHALAATFNRSQPIPPSHQSPNTQHKSLASRATSTPHHHTHTSSSTTTSRPTSSHGTHNKSLLAHTSPLRRSSSNGGLAQHKHVAGSQYCIDAGLHSQHGSPMKQTIKRSNSLSKSTVKPTTRKGLDEQLVPVPATHHHQQQQHTTHTTHHLHHHQADYHLLLQKLDDMALAHSQLLADERERHRHTILEMERRREHDIQQRLLQAETSLRQQLLHDHELERQHYEARLTERHQHIHNTEEQWSKRCMELQHQVEHLQVEGERTRSEMLALKVEHEQAVSQHKIQQLASQGEKHAQGDSIEKLRHTVDQLQQQVLTMTEDSLKLRSKNRDLLTTVTQHETTIHKLREQINERDTEDDRLRQLRHQEADDLQSREHQMKKQVLYLQQVEERRKQAERDRLKQEHEQANYFTKGECAWHSGALNRTLLVLPMHANADGNHNSLTTTG